MPAQANAPSQGQSGSLEYGPQGYYPSAKLRLIVRFDEFGQTNALAAPPTKPIPILAGVQDPRDPLTVVPNPEGPGLLVQSKTGPPATGGPAQVQSKSQDGFTFELGGVIPRDAEWSQNGLRTADQLTATIRYVDCPIDPRTIRSCAVEYYLGTVTEDEYAAGIQGLTRGQVLGADVPNAAEPQNVVHDTYLDSRGRQRTNLRFQGFVDKWVIEFTENGEPMIRIEARDNTSLLIDMPAPPKRVINPSAPLDQAVAQYITFAPAFEGLVVQYLPAGETPPMVGSAIKLLPTSLGPQPSKAGAANATAKLSVWDYLTDVCRSVGHGIRMSGTTIIIQRTRSMTAAVAPTRPDDPFAGGRTLSGTGEVLQQRRFLWGRNLKEFRLSRNYTKHAPQNISVRSYSTQDKRVLVGRFPLPGDRQKYAIPGDAGTDQKWLELTVDDEVHDESQLRIIAQEVYESMSRQEMAVELTTFNLASFGGDNLDPDILDMQAGDAFEVMINRDTTAEFSTLTTVEQMLLSQQQGAALLVSLGFAQGFANAYAQAYTNAGFLPNFRVRTMKASWNVDTGVTLHIQGVNYIAVRADAPLAPGEEPPGTE
jgi:hypothetical protein